MSAVEVVKDAKGVQALLSEPEVKIELGLALGINGGRQVAQVKVGRRKSVLICSEPGAGVVAGRADVLRQLADLLQSPALAEQP